MAQRPRFAPQFLEMPANRTRDVRIAENPHALKKLLVADKGAWMRSAGNLIPITTDHTPPKPAPNRGMAGHGVFRRFLKVR